MNSINKICNEYLKNYWKINASPEKNAKHSEYKRNYRKANAFPEKKEKPDQYQKVYRTNASVDFSIRKFHEVVNQGPVYVCLFMLWLINTHKIRMSNQDAGNIFVITQV